MRRGDQPLPVFRDQHPSHQAVADGAGLPSRQAFGSGHLPIDMNQGDSRAQEADSVALQPENAIAKNSAMQMSVHLLNLWASAHARADYVDEVRVRVEQGGVSSHIMTVPRVDDRRNN